MFKYLFVVILLVCNFAFSQNISSEKEFFEKITGSLVSLNQDSDVFYKSNKLLEYSDSVEIKINLLNEDNVKIQLIKFDIYLLRSYVYLYLAQRYLQDNSYSYGIQLFEKGLDNLKKSLFFFDKCKLILYDFEKNKKGLKTLYDFCFNYYCEYKMKGLAEFKLIENLKNYHPGLQNIKIIGWLDKYYLNF